MRNMEKKLVVFAILISLMVGMVPTTKVAAANNAKATAAMITKGQVCELINEMIGATATSSRMKDIVNYKESQKYYEAMSIAYNAGYIKPNKKQELSASSVYADYNFVATAFARVLGVSKTKIMNNHKPSDTMTASEFKAYMSSVVPNVITKSVANKELIGTTVINKPNVILTNMTIKGNLIIGDGVADQEAILKNVTVTGKLIVRGGGENSIKIYGESNISTVVIKQVNHKVSIKVSDDAEVKVVYINDGCNDVTFYGEVGSVNVAGDNINVSTSNASISSITLTGSNTSLSVSKDTKVGNVTLKETASKASVTIEGEVAKVSSNSAKSVIEVASTANVASIEANKAATGIQVKVSEGAIVKEVGSNAEGTVISGKGKVESATLNGNNSNISTPDTKVTVGANATGVKNNSGNETIPTKAPISVTPATPSTGAGSSSGSTPTEAPTKVPTEAPTKVPTETPTEAPTKVPTETPTKAPTETPTKVPTETPTQAPTESPTKVPTQVPTVEPPVQDVKVTGVTISSPTLNFLVGGASKTLTATISPSNATNKNVSWTSSNENIVKVEDGIVTPITTGSAIITVSTQDGNKLASCEVTVVDEPITGETSPAEELALELNNIQLGCASVDTLDSTKVNLTSDLTISETLTVPASVNLSLQSTLTVGDQGKVINNGIISTPEVIMMRMMVAQSSTKLNVIGSGSVEVNNNANLHFNNMNELLGNSANSFLLYEGAKVEIGKKQYFGTGNGLISLSNYDSSTAPVAGFFFNGDGWMVLVVFEQADVSQSAEADSLDLKIILKAGGMGQQTLPATLNLPNFSVLASCTPYGGGIPDGGTIFAEANSNVTVNGNSVVSKENVDSVFNLSGGDLDNNRGILFYKSNTSETTTVYADARSDLSINRAFTAETGLNTLFRVTGDAPDGTTLNINYEPGSSDFDTTQFGGILPSKGSYTFDLKSLQFVTSVQSLCNQINSIPGAIAEVSGPNQVSILTSINVSNLNVPPTITLQVVNNVVVTVTGMIRNNGTINIVPGGSIVVNVGAVIDNQCAVINNGEIINNGTFIMNPNSTLQGTVTVNPPVTNTSPAKILTDELNKISLDSAREYNGQVYLNKSITISSDISISGGVSLNLSNNVTLTVDGGILTIDSLSEVHSYGGEIVIANNGTIDCYGKIFNGSTGIGNGQFIKGKFTINGTLNVMSTGSVNTYYAAFDIASFGVVNNYGTIMYGLTGDGQGTVSIAENGIFNLFEGGVLNSYAGEMTILGLLNISGTFNNYTNGDGMAFVTVNSGGAINISLTGLLNNSGTIDIASGGTVDCYGKINNAVAYDFSGVFNIAENGIFNMRAGGVLIN